MGSLPSFVAIDFESANANRDSACAIGLTRVEDEKIVEQSSRLIRPPTDDFHYYCTRIHGLHWSDVCNEPTFGELWDDIQHLFEGVSFIAAHNVSFDRSVLQACCRLYGLKMPSAPFLDTVKLARKAWDLKSAKLSSVCSLLDIPLNHHDAGSDAEACAQIILRAPQSAIDAWMVY
jgi:DNA polymerase-3 subunit epsilon